MDSDELMSEPGAPRRKTRSITGATAIVATAIAAAGCGLRDPTLAQQSSRASSQATTSASAAATTTTASTSAPTTSVTPATSATAVLDRFAVTYGDVSATAAVDRDRQLAALATPTYGLELSSDERNATVEAARGLPAGARMVARLISTQLSPAQSNHYRGAVVLEETVELADGAAESPADTTYRGALTRTAAGWRITGFEAEP